MEELHPESLGDAAARDAATLAALQEASELEARDVFDVNGLRLGRVTRSFAEEGMLLRFDVAVDPATRRIVDATQDAVGVPEPWIGRIAEDGIHLRKAAEEVLHPEGKPKEGHEKAGARELPRKVR